MEKQYFLDFILVMMNAMWKGKKRKKKKKTKNKTNNPRGKKRTINKPMTSVRIELTTLSVDVAKRTLVKDTP
jgi:hypothetical protein